MVPGALRKFVVWYIPLSVKCTLSGINLSTVQRNILRMLKKQEPLSRNKTMSYSVLSNFPGRRLGKIENRHTRGQEKAPLTQKTTEMGRFLVRRISEEGRGAPSFHGISNERRVASFSHII